MSNKQLVDLPTKSGEHRHLGQIVGIGTALECAAMIARYSGVVLVVAPDMQTTLRLFEEIKPFTPYQVSLFADWETLPYDSFSPQQEIISDRLSLLSKLKLETKGAIVVCITTLMQKICPNDFLHAHALLMTKGQLLSRDSLCIQLEEAGYRHVDQVMEHGEYSTRGALLDLYPMGSEMPYRIDFMDDEIDSIRTFDVDNQRSLEIVDEIKLLPAHEFPLDKASIELFRSNWRDKFDVLREEEHIYQQVSKGLLPGGIEYWQPLFFERELVSLFDYLPKETLITTLGPLESQMTKFWQDLEYRYENRRVDPMRPLLPPDTLWLHTEEVFRHFKNFPRIQLHYDSLDEKAGQFNLGYQSLPYIAVDAQNKNPLQALRVFLHCYEQPILFSVETEGRREALFELLAKSDIKAKPISAIVEMFDAINETKDAKPFALAPNDEIKLPSEGRLNSNLFVIVGPAQTGCITPHFALICETDLLGERVNQRRQERKRTINADTLIRNLAELNIGQPVVHIEHGVGRYQGLTTLETNGVEAEYLVLTYLNDTKLYVPVASLHMISRYSGGDSETAPLHKLGSDAWSKARQKAAEKIRDVAADLLDVHARRAAKPGFEFVHDKEAYETFRAGFPFETTYDQEQAINAVLSDMCRPIAMDRLVCGDVGFGKTEVAMRAAFLAVNNNKQVAVLVPTTLLAQQHFDNFRDRFANFPVNIELISRFRSAKETQTVLSQTEEGKVDILIGTHKLLQSSVFWKDLGLLIIDEEHRFGVKQKEKIKAMRSDVDILTLTATPIPRTLNMAMSGIRDLSIIATPPARRLPVKTFVRELDMPLIREAILREILRGGQVYYLFNDVSLIEKTKERLAELVPEARIIVGHGQMRERELERVMTDFHHQRYNVLLCTTIVETGIDIASANTMIIERADKFGLAQLHQLRGRVGRSHHQAYAYLLTPPVKALSVDAKKRLEAIATLEDLGAGFTLATHDLEIRGAGELLGEEQSGQITTIGFSLYMDMLDSAVNALKEGKEPSLDDLTQLHAEIDLHMPALFPDDYIHDVSTRLSLYKRLASANTEDALIELRIELVDRFGKLPDATLNLLKMHELRQKADDLGVKRIDAHDKGGFIQFHENNKVDVGVLIALLQQQPHVFRFDGPTKVKFMTDLSDRSKRTLFIFDLLKYFSTQVEQVSEEMAKPSPETKKKK
ncbi:transcription-repair coupling factor [Thorsellia anophelis]|uniref:transcription-repair coupling factor n=1 Tax=Thorsellia anophelis TaxID=336804 RepID=UPI003CCBF86B